MGALHRIYDIDNDGFVSNGELFQVQCAVNSVGLILRLFHPYCSGSEDDGGEQPEGHTASADCGQDHPAL